ncbi:MAG: thiamine phosphate synthase [Gammaproteobacteria bacterium]|nr:thiamine phosphate synthase [Gammaproteobacteria bacterium]NIR83275.1 thiamine phosphate synthase [Gammaproteobacteria bacterium]NIR91075.1 thiamine phosphate synthase [Gammaproteobacteria bacterium]NIU04442.1 thiamine phosphate synthase [Gammaproteobacteria bacterium]NIW87078.1 thiamine phosphate synthase [Gammaproteobacteria bacterium]
MIPFPRRGLYAVTDNRQLAGDALADAVAAAVRGGAAAVQYRDKGGTARERHRDAARLRALCAASGVPFVVNDDVELAAAVKADGVHVGREDATLSEARAALGPEAIIGVSCNNSLARALHAQSAGATYVAFGRFFPSRTKPQAVGATLELLREARPEMQVPVVAIGGITPENGGTLLAAGADVLAAVHGVFGQADPEAAARRYAELFR